MSDLAPFVAAMLRDKSNAEMKQENDLQKQEIDLLRQQLRDTRVVKVTGPNGSPVYAQAQLENGREYDDLNRYQLDFSNPVTRTNQQHAADLQVVLPTLRCAPCDLLNLEIHLGGFGRIEAIQGPFRRAYYRGSNGYGVWYDESPSTGNSALQMILIAIGPFLSEEECHGFDPNNHTTDLQQNTNSMGELLNVYVTFSVFEATVISSLIDNLNQQGQQAQEAAAAAAAADDDDINNNNDDDDVDVDVVDDDDDDDDDNNDTDDNDDNDDGQGAAGLAAAADNV